MFACTWLTGVGFNNTSSLSISIAIFVAVLDDELVRVKLEMGPGPTSSTFVR